MEVLRVLHGSFSKAEWDFLVLCQKKKRLEARLTDAPRTLCSLAIEAVAKNFQYFVDQPENLLQNLPNILVQKFLKTIKERRDDFEPLVPLNWEKSFVLLLLNENVTEFDCNAFDSTRNFPEMYFEHLIQFCPNMRKITFKNEGGFDLTVKILIMRWTNLRSLSIFNYCCKVETLRLIKEYLPGIQQLKFQMESKLFSLKVIEHLAAMHNLLDLCICQAKGHKDPPFDATKLAHAAGKAPRLIKFAYEEYHTNKSSDQFVKKYGELYPNKNLRVPEIWLTDKFDTKWPSNLSVTKLNLVGPIKSDKAIKNICSIKCRVPDITFRGVMPPQMSKIVAALGPHIVNFTILEDSSDQDFRDFLEFDFCQMLSTCPKLQSLRIDCEEFFTDFLDFNFQKPHNGFTQQHFQNYKSFQLNFEVPYFPDYKRFDDIYRMFILGAGENIEKLHVPFGQHEILGDVIFKNPTCLPNLQELCLDFFKGNICDVDYIMDIACRLIIYCPYLKTIKIISEQLNVPLDIIEFHGYFMELIKEIGIELIIELNGDIIKLVGRKVTDFQFNKRPVESDYL